MSSHHDLPPNPREAKYRRAPMHWSAYPVTVILIIASIITAALSRIGEDDSKIDVLYFAGVPEDSKEYRALKAIEKYADEHDIVTGDPDVMRAGYRRVLHHNLKGTSSFTDILNGQVWRLFTPMFIHYGAIHILFNMMWLWDFGRVLEARFRGLRFLLLVLGVSMVANVAQAYLSGPGFGGMSGVNYGLFGFMLIRQQFHPAGDIRLNPQTTPFLLIWLVVCFTGAVGPVANAAHVAGLVGGGVIGWINAMMGGGWGAMQRRRNFQRSLSRSDSVLHRCALCQKTEHDDPNMDFRIGEDGEEYCTDHLPGVRRAP